MKKRKSEVETLCNEILEDTLAVLRFRIGQVLRAEEELDKILGVLVEKTKEGDFGDITKKEVNDLTSALKSLGQVKISELTSLASAVSDKLLPKKEEDGGLRLEDFLD